MKILLVLIATLTSFSTLAANNGSSRGPSSGLSCDMTYSQAGALSTLRTSSSAHFVSSGTLAGDAVTSDGDGIAGTSPANYLKISQVKVNAQTFWSVQVLNSEKSVIGTFSFPYDSGMAALFNVNALLNESEDPPQFDILKVTCSLVSFAG